MVKRKTETMSLAAAIRKVTRLSFDKGYHVRFGLDRTVYAINDSNVIRFMAAVVDTVNGQDLYAAQDSMIGKAAPAKLRDRAKFDADDNLEDE